MKILFYSNDTEASVLLDGLQQALPQHRFIDFKLSSKTDRQEAQQAVVWNPPADFFTGSPNLQLIHSMGAGVDHLLNHPSLPAGVPLVRLEDAGMGAKMAEYVLYGVLHFQRSMDVYRLKQQQQAWDDVNRDRHAVDIRVGVMGLGAMGQAVVKRLQQNGYTVSGWSRSPKTLAGVTTYSGKKSLNDFLAQQHVVVCLLPLTSETEHLINADFLSNMQQGSFLINAGRGRHADTAAVENALRSGQLRGALLDVTHPEPLPPDHTLWSAPGVVITPHTAAPTQSAETVRQIAANIKRSITGEQLQGVVSSDGY